MDYLSSGFSMRVLGLGNEIVPRLIQFSTWSRELFVDLPHVTNCFHRFESLFQVPLAPLLFTMSQQQNRQSTQSHHLPAVVPALEMQRLREELGADAAATGVCSVHFMIPYPLADSN